MAHTPPRQSTSAIEIPGPHHSPLQNYSSTSYAGLPNRTRSYPMSVPHVHDSAPPPLPPPRWVEDYAEGTDPGWDFENRAEATSTTGHNSAPIKLGSSLLGGHQARSSRTYTGPERKVDFEPKSAFPGEFKSEGSDPSADLRMPDLREVLEYNKLQSEKQMGQKTLERSSHAYDKHLLSRIGGPRTPPVRPGETPVPTSGGEESPSSMQNTTSKKANGQTRTLAMPERRHSDMDARTPQAGAQQWTVSPGAAPPSSALSPRFSGMRSPLSEHGMERTLSHPQRSSTMKSEEGQMAPGRLLHTHSYDQSYPDPQESSTRSPGIQQLNIQDRSPAAADDYQQNQKTGQKRRAQSPPSDSVLDPRLPNNGEPWQRRQVQSNLGRNNANMARFQTPNSLSSATSSLPQSASFTSTAMLSNPSTATSYNSERLSPGAYQRAEVAANMNNMAVHPPGRIDPNNPPPIPQRRATNSNIPRAPGLWICDCCPKKPKKFENEDGLRIHEMEKQYICQYCHNRFKNKNEAERHQNSLHLRRHSWSCAALTSFEAAFHATPSNSVIASIQGTNAPYNTNDPTGVNIQHNPVTYPGALHSTPTDTCGYCGLEFVNPPNWDERVEHLNHVHKFGECNQSKKFFRADHFRQHLKHSHAGTSGKWTNMLENACMKDEPPPQPLGHATLPPGMPGIAMVGQQQLLAAAAAAAAEQGVTHGGMSGYDSPGLVQSSMDSPNMGMVQNMNQGMGQNINHNIDQNLDQSLAQGMNQGSNQTMAQSIHQAMGGGAPSAPIASMLAAGVQQQQGQGQGQ